MVKYEGGTLLAYHKQKHNSEVPQQKNRLGTVSYKVFGEGRGL